MSDIISRLRDAYMRNPASALALLPELFEAEERPNQPPLGIMPEWLFEERRIKELAQAIERQINSDRPNMNLVSIWAEELHRRASAAEQAPKGDPHG